MCTHVVGSWNNPWTLYVRNPRKTEEISSVEATHCHSWNRDTRGQILSVVRVKAAVMSGRRGHAGPALS